MLQQFIYFCVLFQAEKEEQVAVAEKAVAKETPDQWAPDAVAPLTQPEVTDWATEAMNPPPAQTMAGQFSMTTPATDDWSAQTEDWSSQVPASTSAPAAGAGTGAPAPPTTQWGGDTVESWN